MNEVKKCPKCGDQVTRVSCYKCEKCGYVSHVQETQNQEVENELVQEARNSLLQHFSSKSTNQTAIILTLAIIFFSFVQALRYVEALPNWVANLIVVLILTTLSFLTIRALARLFLWGKMAGAVLYVRMLTKKELKDGKHLAQRTPERLILTPHLRLDRAAAEETKKHMHFLGRLLDRLVREPNNYLVWFCMFSIFAISFAISSVPQPTIEFYVSWLLSGGIAILLSIYRYKRKKKRVEP